MKSDTYSEYDDIDKETVETIELFTGRVMHVPDRIKESAWQFSDEYQLLITRMEKRFQFLIKESLSSEYRVIFCGQIPHYTGMSKVVDFEIWDSSGWRSIVEIDLDRHKDHFDKIAHHAIFRHINARFDKAVKADKYVI